jgi:hypothetical protein
MAKILIDNIQQTGDSFFTDDQSFISELSDLEMQTRGGGGVTDTVGGNLLVGGLLELYFDPSQLEGLLQIARDLNQFYRDKWGDSSTQASQGSGLPTSSSAPSSGGCLSFRPSPYPYAWYCPSPGYYGPRRRRSSC